MGKVETRLKFIPFDPLHDFGALCVLLPFEDFSALVPFGALPLFSFLVLSKDWASLERATVRSRNALNSFIVISNLILAMLRFYGPSENGQRTKFRQILNWLDRASAFDQGCSEFVEGVWNE